MGFFSNWPFSNLHNLNLDWLIEQVKKLTDVTDHIWDRVKPIDGGDPSTITAAQAYSAASLAQDTADRASQSATTANTSINNHTANKNNPHEVTPQQIGAEPAIGVLDVSKGGTGANNPVAARASLGARADFTILPVSDGGTGSSTAAGARDALGVNLANLGGVPLAGGVTITGDMTFAGNLTVSNDKSAEGYVRIWEDNEGGNIAIVSKEGKEFQIDAYNDTTLRCYAYDDSGKINGFNFDRTNGNFSCDGNFYQSGNRIADVQHGYINVGTSGTTITFQHAFSGVPSVTATGSKLCHLCVNNITNTGFTVTSGEDNNTVNWIAAY